MISLPMALRLKRSGLRWTPKLNDLFAVPERGMDANIFVLSDLQANIESLFGSEVVAFQGASEWALDYLVSNEAVWMPREEQLRAVLMELLPERELRLRLVCSNAGFNLEVSSGDLLISTQARQAEDAYAEALLQVLNIRKTGTP
jgi:hypothetical protein